MTDVSLADQLRQFVIRHYLSSSRQGQELLALADEIEKVENRVRA